MRTASGLIIAARAYARTRWLQRRLKSRARIEAWQARQLAKLGRHLVRHMPFYRDRGETPDAWPVLDKAAMLANFEALNVPGLTLDAVRAAVAAGQPSVAGYPVGRSTGTSGNRGYYVISDAERFVWLGTLLAKALPDALWRRHRVALALPGISTLYRAAGSGSRIALGAFDLAEEMESWRDRLAAFAPDTIVAPPKVLRLLAEDGRLGATHIFSGAEVLDPLDRAAIEGATGRRVREIYMATEGLFGVACPHGTLHLAEDAVHFEWEDAPDGLVAPVVTDFIRRTQAMARYRMNDLLQLDDQPCPCGSALQPVRRIEGRQDDVFLCPDPSGTLRSVTPDVLRNAVVDADPRIDDFRIAQLGPSAIEVRLAAALPPAVDAAVRATLAMLVERMGLAPIDIAVARGIDVPFDRKLRRVERRWRPD
jgi:putative adenylate-forming enzyme